MSKGFKKKLSVSFLRW